MKIDDLLQSLQGVRRSTNGGWSALCPAHDDQRRSLSVSEAANGRVLVHCFAGCSYQEILRKLGGSDRQTITATYDYRDESGKLLYQNVRFEPKDFRFRRINAQGDETWDLNGIRRVPYRLNELSKLDSLQDLVLAEGEKDADRLTELGFPASSHKNWRSEFNYLAKGRNVLIFQDHDIAGRKQALDVARTLVGVSSAIKIVDCFSDDPSPGSNGRDVSDYLADHSLDDLRELIRQIPEWVPDAEGNNDPSELETLSFAEIESTAVEWLWEPLIPKGEFTIIEGIEGLGKTFVACAIASDVATGRALPFSTSAASEETVLFISGEDSVSATLKPRLIGLNAPLDRIFTVRENFNIANNSDFAKFVAAVEKHLPALVIIDPLFAFTGGRDLNRESESRPIAHRLISIAQRLNCAIIGVRHVGKAKGGGDARAAGLGSIAWRASARSVILVGRDEETGETALCQTKNNLASRLRFSVGFEIKDDGSFQWLGQPSKLTAERMLKPPKDEETRAELAEAVTFLTDALSDGDRPSKEIDQEARERGFSKYMLRQAKSKIGARSVKKGGNFGGENAWYITITQD